MCKAALAVVRRCAALTRAARSLLVAIIGSARQRSRLTQFDTPLAPAYSARKVRIGSIRVATRVGRYAATPTTRTMSVVTSTNVLGS